MKSTFALRATVDGPSTDVGMASPEGIDHGKARPKAEAVWLILSGEPIRGRRPRIGDPNIRQLEPRCRIAQTD